MAGWAPLQLGRHLTAERQRSREVVAQAIDFSAWRLDWRSRRAIPIAGGEMPQLGNSICIAEGHGDHAAVPRDRNVSDIVKPTQLTDLPAAGHVPNSDGITAAGNGKPPVWREGRATNGALVFQAADFAAGLDVQDTHSAVLATDKRGMAIG